MSTSKRFISVGVLQSILLMVGAGIGNLSDASIDVGGLKKCKCYLQAWDQNDESSNLYGYRLSGYENIFVENKNERGDPEIYYIFNLSHSGSSIKLNAKGLPFHNKEIEPNDHYPFTLREGENVAIYSKDKNKAVCALVVQDTGKRHHGMHVVENEKGDEYYTRLFRGCDSLR